MKALQSMVTGLRSAAATLRDTTVVYDWYSAPQCNSGILAQALGVQKSYLDTSVYGSWILMSSDFTAGRATPNMAAIFNAMIALGLEPTDYFKIERLLNTGRNYKDRYEVAAYFDLKADALQLILNQQNNCIATANQGAINL